jgi:kynurenine formamidase
LITTIKANNKAYTIDLLKPLDISIPLRASEKNVNAWYVDEPKMKKELSIANGDPVNFNTLTINPHAHGTHTETVGHIIDNGPSINKVLKQFFHTAELISVAPERKVTDMVISMKQVKLLLKQKKSDALIIRTMPNTLEKKSRQYSNTNWPYIDPEAMDFMVERGIKHLLIDQPSVDKEKDDGQLLSHKAFWDIKGHIRKDCTITELIYVPNKVKDGSYILNLQIAPFENDAAPSKPILYKIE